MSTIVSRLAPKDKRALALFYETDGYIGLKKLVNLVKKNAADQALKSPNHETTKWLQGQAYTCDRLIDELEKVYKSEQKS